MPLYTMRHCHGQSRNISSARSRRFLGVVGVSRARTHVIVHRRATDPDHLSLILVNARVAGSQSEVSIGAVEPVLISNVQPLSPQIPIATDIADKVETLTDGRDPPSNLYVEHITMAQLNAVGITMPVPYQHRLSGEIVSIPITFMDRSRTPAPTRSATSAGASTRWWT